MEAAGSVHRARSFSADFHQGLRHSLPPSRHHHGVHSGSFPGTSSLALLPTAGRSRWPRGAWHARWAFSLLPGQGTGQATQADTFLCLPHGGEGCSQIVGGPRVEIVTPPPPTPGSPVPAGLWGSAPRFTLLLGSEGFRPCPCALKGRDDGETLKPQRSGRQQRPPRTVSRGFASVCRCRDGDAGLFSAPPAPGPGF